MSKTRVIIADDHATFAESLQRALDDDEDIEVVGIACNGLEAVQLSKEKKPEVVVMDIAMPEMNGIEATRQIKKILPSSSILVLSGYGYTPYVFSVLEAGAAGYLLKNVHLKEVVNAIKSLRSGETVFDKDIAEKILRQLSKSWKGSGGSPKRLNQRELEILKLGAKSLSNDEISEQLNISPRTVQTHFTNIFTKLSVGSRLEAILHSLKEGWLVLDDLP